MPGTYFIIISAYNTGGQYQLQINCISVNNDGAHALNHTGAITIPSTSTIPNSTLTYTTSYSVIPGELDDCDYHSIDTQTISPAKNIFDAITIINNTIEIQFEIKLNDYCNKSLCNVFHMYHDDYAGSISLSINGLKNYFQISIVNAFNFNDIYRIPNANTLLPVDNQYHNFYLSYTYTVTDLNHNQNIFKIDDYVHYYPSTVPTKILTNQTYKLYMSNPWNVAVNAVVSDICIKSLIPQTSETKCGDILTGELHSKSDVNYYYFQLLGPSIVLFDSCGSTYDTVLRLYDMHFTKLAEADDDGNCGFQAQLIQPKLFAGKYILEISGFGADLNHDYGAWRMKIVCDTLYHIDQPCTTGSCWDNEHHFDNHILNDDTIQLEEISDYYKWPNQVATIAYWKSKLYIIGLSQIHYTHMQLFGSEYQWHHKTYNHNITMAWNARLYAQYQSSVYMLASNIQSINGRYGESLIHIDLISLDIEFNAMHTSETTNIFSHTKCAVAGSHFLYGVTETVIVAVKVANWNISNVLEYQLTDFDESCREPVTCTISNDQKYVYVFSVSYDGNLFFISKYDTIDRTIQRLPTSSLCMIRSGIVGSVTGRNNKMYLHGCYIKGWKTLIFDPETETFQNKTIDMNAPTVDSVEDINY
eukprot:455766_1